MVRVPVLLVLRDERLVMSTTSLADDDDGDARVAGRRGSWWWGWGGGGWRAGSRSWCRVERMMSCAGMRLEAVVVDVGAAEDAEDLA